MNRNTRTLVVVLVALVAAGIASFGAYRMIRDIPIRQVEVSTTMIVAATRPVTIGARLTAQDLKLIAWPSRTMVPGSFTKI